jgi:hypothetical protein
MNGVIGQVEDIHLEGGGVTLDPGGNVYWLEGVRELDDELGRFREVLFWLGGGVEGACPADVSAIARLDVSMSCNRATVSWPVISVKRGIESLPYGLRLRGPVQHVRTGHFAVVVRPVGRERKQRRRVPDRPIGVHASVKRVGT